MFYLLYNIVLALGMVILVPYYGAKILFTGKYRKSIGPKLGFLDTLALKNALKGYPRIWIHAVSVGEVTAAAPIVEKLRSNKPDACILLSTSTETGQEMAIKIVSQASAFFLFSPGSPFYSQESHLPDQA